MQLKQFSTKMLLAVLFVSCNFTPTRKHPIDFIKTYEGTININLKIIIKLVVNNGNVTGKYFYKNVGKDMALKGTFTEDGKLQIQEINHLNTVTGEFNGTAENPNKITGFWKNTSTNESMPFELLATNTAYEQIQKMVTDEKSQGITGIYKISTDTPDLSMESSAIIKYLGDNKFSFDLTVATPDCNGKIEGIAKINNLGVGEFSNNSCKSILFKFVNSKQLIIEESDCQWHGAGCQFAGTYTK